MIHHRRIAVGALAALGLAASLGACGSSDDNDNGSSSSPPASGSGSGSGGGKYAGNLIKKVPNAAAAGTITVGSKNFTEQFILGSIYADALRAAGFKVKKQLNIGAEQVAYKALRAGRIDLYPEYTGTSLTSFFKVKTDAVPRDANQAYEQSKADYAKVGITALPVTPFENTYRLAMPTKKWQAAGSPKVISALKPNASKLKITGYPECEQRTDCYLGVQKTYGLKFKKFVASNQTYEVLDKGAADVAFVFTTDGPLASGKYKILDDDKNLFPPYNISVGIRSGVAQKLGAAGQKVITDVQKYMTNQVMQQLNGRVDIKKEPYSKAAQDYLKAYGFIK